MRTLPPLRVLIVDDSERDAELLAHVIARGGYAVTAERVETVDALRTALAEREWDLVLADDNMAHFDGLEALELLQESGIDLPFLIVSGSIGEETAVALMKAGAHDVIMKDRLARLVPAIERELREVAGRRSQRPTETALRRREAMLAMAQRIAHVGSWEQDCRTWEVVWSDEAYRIFGHEPRAFPPDYATFLNLIHPDDRERVRQGIEAALDAGRSHTFEHRIVLPDGSVRCLFNQVEIEVDACGRPIRQVGTVHDITERQQAEEQIHFQAHLLDQALAAVISTDLDGVVLHWNAHAERLYGWSRDEVLGRHIDGFGVGPLDPTVDAEMVERFAAGRSWTAEYLTRHRDGTRFPVHATMSPILDGQGCVAGVVGVTVDISDRKRAEEALRASEADYRLLLEQAADGIIVIDSTLGRLVTVNSRAGEMLGYAADELRGRNLLEFLDPADLARRPLRVDALATGMSLINERHLRRKDGTLLPTETSSKRLEDGRTLIILRDITERQRAEEALRAAETRYRQLVEQVPVATATYAADDPDFPLYVSPQIEQLTGYSPDEWLGTPGLWSILVHPDDRLLVDAESQRTDRTGEPFSVEFRIITRDGRIVWAHEHAVLIRDDAGAPLFWQAIMSDITARKQAEAALRESEERFHNAFDNAPIGMALVAPDGRWLQANPAACVLTGYSEAELQALTSQEITHPDDRDADVKFVRQALAGERDTYQIEKRYVRKDGRIVWVLLSVSLVRASDGTPDYYIGQIQDISERKAYERQLLHQAFHDRLTGLANRALFMDRLAHALTRVRDSDCRVAVLYIDLDRLKPINDSLGHDAGDRLLMAVAERLRHCLREQHTVARLGSDEFTVLLDDATELRDAITVAERIHGALREPFQVGSHEIVVSASIGIVLSTPGHARADELLRDADIAMYRAKTEGRARYAVYDPSMDAAMLQRLELESDLRRALIRDELRVYYQPIVSLATGRLIGVEALVRWEHPTRGLILPAAFIPLAEETGLIVPIGKWVLERACRQVQAWWLQDPSLPRLVLNVNLSAPELQHPDLVADVGGVLRRTGIDPQSLKLEITESVVMADAAATGARLQQLKALGVRLAIDDFGTGFSSLSYLKRFPVDTLKIDKAFVNGLGRDPEDSAIVQAMISLAGALGMSVTAEGIETAEAVALLQELGCESGQGYYFARPLPAEVLEASTLPPSASCTAIEPGTSPVRR